MNVWGHNLTHKKPYLVDFCYLYCKNEDEEALRKLVIFQGHLTGKSISRCKLCLVSLACSGERVSTLYGVDFLSQL